MLKNRIEFDALTLEIMWGRLISIVDESAATLVRTSFSTIVRESNDFACALLDSQGNTVADASANCPVFLGTMPRTLRHCLGKFPPEDLEPGDAILTNDPWIGTGHVNDFTLIAPVFHQGRLVAFAGNTAHTPDIGGMIWGADAREVYEEGLRIMPVKLMKAGELNEQLADLIRANVRVPEQVMGDLHAQVAAAEMCGRRLVDLLEEQEMEGLSALGNAIFTRAEAVMRRSIEEIPDGEYTHTIETDGFDHPLTIRIKITVMGSELHVDYSGTSPQIDRGLNSVYNYSYSQTTYPLKCILDPVTPKNEGSFRPITVDIPEGTILNPRFPAPVGARNLTGHYLSAAVIGALAPAIPAMILADCSGPPTRIVFAGEGYHGDKFSQVLFPQGGMGAKPTQDGLSCTPFPSNTGAGSIEVVESVAPLIFWKRGLIPDSGGAGKFRGGLAEELVIELASPKPTQVSVVGERIHHPPLGLLGGLPGMAASVTLASGEPLHPKSRTLLPTGSIVHLGFPGGGGFGPPKDRDSSMILSDLENELITPEAARHTYGLEF